MTTPRTIDHAVKVLFRAITATAQGDRLTVMTACSGLVALAGAMDGFEGQLVAAVVDRLAPSLPNASRDEIARAISIDIRRHVGNSLRLAETEPWGHA